MSRAKAGSVSIHEGAGVQARFGGAYGLSKWFRLSQYPGGLDAATAAAERDARAWLAEVAPSIPRAQTYRVKPARSKGSDLMAGVSRSLYHDARRGMVAVRYQVLYYVGGERRIKSFWLGPEDKLTDKDNDVGRQVAEGCRRAFLRASELGHVFNIEPWNDWRSLFGVETSWRDGRSAIAHQERIEELVNAS